jgi:hypothetical protein
MHEWSIHLAEVGQHVTVDPGLHPQLARETWTVADVGRTRDGNEFVVLQNPRSGATYKWINGAELLPAPAGLDPREGPRIVEDGRERHMADMNAARLFLLRTQQIESERRAIGDRIDLARAIAIASNEDEAGAVAYRLAGLSADASTIQPVISLSARAGETFDAVCERVASERGISLREAIHVVGEARPELASAR